ncbi:MAG: hypothetical protein H7332_00130 [Bdellovibrionales bacterium]|nr:hypothetical protein [Ramlibacter sp.]
MSTVPPHDASGPPALQPAALTDSLRRTVMATVVFVDLVGYAAHSAAHQVMLKTRFNELLAKAVRGVDDSSRIIMGTNEGAAICFLGDPEEALESALLMRDLVLHKYRGALLLRLGLHLGPVRLLSDGNERLTMVGDGVNVAQRIMDFALVNQIVVSRAYHEVISRITDNLAPAFRHLGPHLDKHLRSHDIYAVVEPQASRVLPPSERSEFDRTAPQRALVSTLTPEIAEEVESDLARLIGPMARVLVKKAVFRVNSAAALRELLAVSIQDRAARDAFVSSKPRPVPPRS